MKTATIVLPSGYATAEEFAKDCGFELPAVPALGTPVAWQCIDERREFRYIKGIVSVDKETVEAWKDVGIAFVGLGRIDVPAQGEPVAWRWKWKQDQQWSLAPYDPKFASDAAVTVQALGVLAEGQPTIIDEMHTALAEMHDSMARARDMLADVPGNSLDEVLTNYIGSYMALQVEVQELRSRSPAVSAPVEEAPTSTLRAAAQALVHEIAESGTHLRWKRLSHALETEDERIAALRSPAASASDIERAFTDVCDELGCKYDNEAALEAIDALKRRSQPDTSNEEPRG